MKRIIGILLFPMILGACAGDVDTAIKKAKAESNPAISLDIVRQLKQTYVDECSPWLSQCVPEDLAMAEEEYFVKAAEAGDEKTLRELFTDRMDHLTLKNALKTSVIDRAKNSNNADLLFAAAGIVGNDKLGVINRADQIHYFKMAWQAGDKKAAGELAHRFARMKDYSNAYFWSLRCIQDCKRRDYMEVGGFAERTELSELEQHLDASQITKLQAESALTAVTTNFRK